MIKAFGLYEPKPKNYNINKQLNQKPAAEKKKTINTVWSALTMLLFNNTYRTESFTIGNVKHCTTNSNKLKYTTLNQHQTKNYITKKPFLKFKLCFNCYFENLKISQ